MPSAYEYNPDDKALRDAADNELKERRELHALNWEYNIGKHPKYLKKNGGYDDNVILNIARQSVDRTLSFLIPEFPHITLEDEANTDLENELWNVWKINGGAVLLYNMATNGAVDGHVFAKIQPDEMGNIRIYNLNSANVCVFWNGDDIDDVLWYELRWRVGSKHYRQDIVRDGNRWLMLDYVKVGNNTQWTLDMELIGTMS